MKAVLSTEQFGPSIAADGARQAAAAKGITEGVISNWYIYLIDGYLGEGPDGSRLYRVLDPLFHYRRSAPKWVVIGDRVRMFRTLAEAESVLFAGLDDPGAGWDHPVADACWDGTQNVSYPWHEPYVPGPGDVCIRCGQRCPPEHR